MPVANTVTNDNSTTNRWQILASLTAFSVLVVLTTWAMLLVTNPESTVNNANNSITGTVISTSMTNTASSVSTAADIEFAKQVSLINPVNNNSTTVSYSGLIPENTAVTVAESSSENNQAGDLTIENAEFKLFLTIEWEEAQPAEIEKGNLITVSNPQSSGILRLSNPDSNSTSDYSYFRSLGLDKCEGLDASSLCVAYGLPFSQINLTAKCQVQQVTGLKECDQALANLKVSLK